MFTQQIYEEKFKSTGHVSIIDSIYHQEVQPIEDRLEFFKRSSNIKDFYVPSGNKKVDELVEILLETIHFRLQFEDDVSLFSETLPLAFKIGTR